MAKSLRDLLAQDKISNGDVRYMSDEVKEELMKLTESCTGSIRERLYWLQHNLSNYPTCATCFTSLTSKNFRTNTEGGGYTLTCSVSCAKRNPELNAKYKETLRQKYGSESYLGSHEARKRIEATNLAKYGSKTPAPWGSEKFKDSMVSKYGVDNCQKDNVLKAKIIKSTIETNIISGKTEASILACQAARNVECTTVELALDPNRNKLENVQLKWKHLTCGNVYSSAITDGQITVCPHCNNGASVLELSLRSTVLELCPNDEAVFKAKGIIPGNLELDIYVPSKKLAIEFNGIYWHSTIRNDDKNKHLLKTELCQKNDIRLIHIWEHHFIQNPLLIKSMIANALGLSKKIAARKCDVREIPSAQANAFLKQNHLNSFLRTKVNVGLFLKDELVAVMTFGKKRFGKSNPNDWEIYRFCSLAGHQIQGGASKLFSYFVNQYNPDRVMSFADRCLGGGDTYLKLGMTEEVPTPPAYFWANRHIATHLSRFKTQKHKLKNLLGDKFDENLSEDGNMKKLGWFKLWDCGNRKFSWVKSN